MARRIMWVRTVGTGSGWPVADTVGAIKEDDTEIEIVTPAYPETFTHVEYRAYEAMVFRDVVGLAYAAGRRGFDAMIIGCFYDPALKEAREVSGNMIVVGPCQATVDMATTLANRFSVIVTRRKCIDQMTANIREYGKGHALASMRSIDIGVERLHADHDETERRIIEQARLAVEEDGAEAIILGCTAKYGFDQKVQRAVGVPVIDAVSAPFKLAEHMAGLKQRLGLVPSRVWSCEAPPADEIERFGLFRGPAKAPDCIVVGAANTQDRRERAVSIA